MKRITAILTAALFLASGAAIAGNCEDGESIVDLAASTPDLSTLVAAVVKADLVSTLDGNRNFTVFAPTNDAFDAAAEALLGPGNTGLDLVSALSVEDLTAVLLYHVAPGERFSEDVLGAKQVRMLDKNFSLPAIRDGMPFINDARIVIPDIDACNGAVHVIGAVLLPPAA